jgi:hypothetical protein
MFSVPRSGSYVVGNAHAGDDLADLCWVAGSDGNIWDMVLDRNGWGGDHLSNTAAFIPQYELVSGAQGVWCGALLDGAQPGLGSPVTAWPFNNTVMSSAPAVGSYYVGTENNTPTSAPLAIICSINNWFLVLDYNGIGGNHYSYTAAFIPQDRIARGLPGQVNSC